MDESERVPCESVFNAKVVPLAPEDLHYGLRALYQADKSQDKLNLVIGAYRDDNCKPWILPVVKKADAILHQDSSRNNEYLPIPGDPKFTSAARHLILGSDSVAIKEHRVCSFQTISGTGAVHFGGAFLAKFLPKPTPSVYLSEPTWDNHVSVFSNVGLPIAWYPYFSAKDNTFDIEGMLMTLQEAPLGSIVLLQPCAHNPTGLDPAPEEWKQIATVMRSRKLFPFFDCAYQGFATGSLTRDNWAVRYFVNQGFEMLIAQSFSKNLGLYGQRVGCLHYVAPPGTNATSAAQRVASQLAVLQRAEISTPPIYGARIASIVLNDATLFTDWEEDLRTMADRITDMRVALREELERLGTPGNWGHITRQIGMFSYTGLREPEVLELRERWHVYLLPSGRISMAGLSKGNLGYFAKAVDDVVRRHRH